MNGNLNLVLNAWFEYNGHGIEQMVEMWLWMVLKTWWLKMDSKIWKWLKMD